MSLVAETQFQNSIVLVQYILTVHILFNTLLNFYHWYYFIFNIKPQWYTTNVLV